MVPLCGVIPVDIIRHIVPLGYCIVTAHGFYLFYLGYLFNDFSFAWYEIQILYIYGYVVIYVYMCMSLYVYMYMDDRLELVE